MYSGNVTRIQLFLLFRTKFNFVQNYLIIGRVSRVMHSGYEIWIPVILRPAIVCVWNSDFYNPTAKFISNQFYFYTNTSW